MGTLEQLDLLKSDPTAWVRQRKNTYVIQTIAERKYAVDKLQDLAILYERERQAQYQDSEHRIKEIFTAWEQDMYAARTVLLASGMSEEEVGKIMMDKQ